MITCTGFLTNCEPVRDASRENLFYKCHELSYQSGIFLFYLFIWLRLQTEDYKQNITTWNRK